MRRTVTVLVGLALLLVLALPAAATGPYDGLYAFLLSNASGSFLNYGTVTQNGSAFLLINLFVAPLPDGGWTFGVGTITGNAASGTLYFLTGQSYGTFAVVISGAHIAGSAVVNGTAYTVSGDKIF
jgi:hypothetical protein